MIAPGASQRDRQAEKRLAGGAAPSSNGFPPPLTDQQRRLLEDWLVELIVDKVVAKYEAERQQSHG